jgi:F-type H+-transporting ATPase subunit epsilon
MKLNLLTPERKAVYDVEITEVTIPAYSGEMTVKPGHAPLITTLGTGIISYRVKNQDIPKRAVISWGYCEVAPEAVNVLAEFVQTKDEVFEDQAKKQIVEGEQKLAKQMLTDDEFEQTIAGVQKARAGLRLLNH